MLQIVELVTKLMRLRIVNFLIKLNNITTNNTVMIGIIEKRFFFFLKIFTDEQKFDQANDLKHFNHNFDNGKFVFIVALVYILYSCAFCCKCLIKITRETS